MNRKRSQYFQVVNYIAEATVEPKVIYVRIILHEPDLSVDTQKGDPEQHTLRPPEPRL